jgi:hypothetical protein
MSRKKKAKNEPELGQGKKLVAATKKKTKK